MSLNSFIWDKLAPFILGFAGLYLLILLGGFQFFKFPLWWRKTFGTLFKRETKLSSKGSISPFASVCTSLAATLGVGNIVGVGSAICIGGPGAVFWMWIAAFLGMGTSYAENVLGIYFRRKNINGQWCGGAMYYLEDGLGSVKGFKSAGKYLAYIFSAFTVLSSFGMGSMGQINKIVLNITQSFPLNNQEFCITSFYPLFLGILLFILALLACTGGLKQISSITEKMVPFMIVFFVAGSLYVIIKNIHNVVPAFKEIFSSAFSFKAGFGGSTGFVMARAFSAGFKRGVFSNEAGLGSSVIVHASTSLREPCEQGMWGMFEVFVDTIVLCTFTAMVVLTSGAYNLSTGQFLGTDSTLVAVAFNLNFPGKDLGGKFVAICIFLFSFSTVIGWNHYGAKAWEYLFGQNTVFIFKTLHLLSIPLGAVLTSSLAWTVSDIFNGLMMLPNLIAVIFLSGYVKEINKNYILRNIKGHKIKPMLSYFKNM